MSIAAAAVLTGAAVGLVVALGPVAVASWRRLHC